MTALPAAAARVQEALRAAGSDARVREMPETTRTAADAARACGVAVGAIVKSLVFRAGDAPVLVLTSGANRVDEAGLGRRIGTALDRADAGFVREATGFAIGGVPPLGHRAAMRVLVDRDLGDWPQLWAAAGTPRAVFPTTLDELVRLTGGEVVAVA